jgi:uncharacterized protein (DUF2141 family)
MPITHSFPAPGYAAAGLQDVAGAGVGDGDDAGLRRQGLQPVGEGFARAASFPAPSPALIDHAAILLLGDQLAKRVFALYGPAFTAGAGRP